MNNNKKIKLAVIDIVMWLAAILLLILVMTKMIPWFFLIGTLIVLAVISIRMFYKSTRKYKD